MCSSNGCHNPPIARPVVVVRSKVAPRTGIRCTLSLGLCVECKAATTLQDVLTDEGWDLISSGLQKHGVQPDRSLTSLDFCDIDSEEGRAVVARRVN